MSPPPRFTPIAPPYLPRRRHVCGLMGETLAALVPGGAALVWHLGPGVLIQCLIALAAAEASEALVLRLRRRPVAPTLADGSAALTAVLLALSLPPLLPGWLTAFGAAWAIVVGKQLYGGLGHNPFNPAMVGYAALLVSFPRPMAAGYALLEGNPTPLGFRDAWQLIVDPGAAALLADATTHATRLSGLKAPLAPGGPAVTADTPFTGGAAWANLGFLLGGLWLLGRRLIDWRIPAAFLATLSALTLALFLIDPARHAPPSVHLFGGGTMLGAFFIATDPVSAATTPAGRLIFGAGIGALVVAIRAFGGYPDGVAFAVLLLNLAAPTLDRFTRPRVLGETR
ncbi:RnfABCDGE type electron transport complex subunit D [Candidatus Methylocalor cossyra]|uniref:Ion-translocating oxidoreductase complex subunit D n=1 Tax=Candidatus Methylocalor cossyra TaxID=3108543 RepID=A0ABM9NG97_9GAMM